MFCKYWNRGDGQDMNLGAGYVNETQNEWTIVIQTLFSFDNKLCVLWQNNLPSSELYFFRIRD